MNEVLRPSDVAEVMAYPPGMVEIGPVEAAAISALCLVPFAKDNGVDPDHPTPREVARQVVGWLTQKSRQRREASDAAFESRVKDE